MANSAAVFLSSLFNIPNGIKKDEDLISLKDLYKRTNDKKIDYGTEGNFIQASDGTILFFQPGVRKSLGYIAAEAPSTSSCPFKIWSTVTKNSTIAELPVVRNGNSLKIGQFTIGQTELDRHAISSDFTKVLRYCKSLFSNPPEGGEGGLGAPSIIRLAGSKFLITGGSINCNYPTPEMLALEKTATVFDAETCTVINTFPLRSRRSRHQSRVLPSGKVLLIGSFTAAEPIEIINVEAGTSRYLNCQFDEKKECFTSLIDNQGNCYVIGGFNSETHTGAKTVEKIDMQREMIIEMPDLKLPRAFLGPGAPFHVQQCALVLTDNSILISGGRIKVMNPWGGKHNLTAEVYRTAN